MKILKAGAILAVIGIALVFVSSVMAEEERNLEYKRRIDYLEKKYPPSGYRPPEYAQYLFAPYPPMPSESLVGVGWILAGIGVLTVFIKLVQGTD